MVFRPNPAFARELQREPEVRARQVEAAKQALPHVERLLRQAGGSRLPRKGHEPVEVQTDFEGVAVVMTGHGDHWAEWGNVNSPPHAPLRRGVKAAGFSFREEHL